MWRQLGRWIGPFLPSSKDRIMWFCFIMGFCVNIVISASASEEASRPVIIPDFAVIEIGIRLGNQRVPLSFKVKLAETEEQRRHGLMFTPYLPKKHGMLFVFETDAPRQFWMKNTQIPLDILFFASDGRLVNIIHSAVPFSLTLRNSVGPACYVLELNGGVARKIGIQQDAQLVLPLVGQKGLSTCQKK